MIILHEKSAHWYRADKETHVISPFHEVPCKSRPGEMRSTTIKDARSTPGAMVSVSTIMKVKAKPALDDWKIKQALMAAMTITRLPGEGDEAYVDRILADMDAESKIAREKGTAVHDVVEMYLLAMKKENYAGWDVGANKEALSLAAPCLDSIDNEVEEIYGVEAVVGNPALGYAGRLDLHGKMRGIGEAVVDFKTQKVKRDKKGVPKPTFYWEWGKQLAAYAHCDHSGYQGKSLVSIIIDTTEPGPVFIHRWPDPGREWKMFCNLLEIWKDENEWSPMP